MKIAEIERFSLRLQPKDLGQKSAETIIVRVRADSGISGLGEAAAVGSDASRSRSTLLAWLQAYETALIGADALNINAIGRMLDGVANRHPPGCQAARAAIDMAVHDLVGKARGCPVHEILGGAYRTEFDLFADVAAGTDGGVAAAARSAVGLGFRGLSVDIGDDLLPPIPTGKSLERKSADLAAVIEAVGADVYVDTDANQSLGNPALVSSMFERILKARFYPNLALRQPLHVLDFKGHAALRAKLPIPIVLEQSVVSPEAMMQIERLGAADRIILSAERVGGLQSAMRIADICEAAAIGVTPAASSCTKIADAAHCHIAAALHDAYPISVGAYRRFEATPVTGGFEIRDGRAILGHAPGLGVELDEVMLGSMIDPDR
jgi:L-alanine-DL-glutamate epimerase-like enolase superfamily enzyme